jgi:hypothetical protein
MSSEKNAHELLDSLSNLGGAGYQRSNIIAIYHDVFISSS